MEASGRRSRGPSAAEDIFDEVDGRVRHPHVPSRRRATPEPAPPRKPIEWVGRTEAAAQRTVVLLQRTDLDPAASRRQRHGRCPDGTAAIKQPLSSLGALGRFLPCDEGTEHYRFTLHGHAVPQASFGPIRASTTWARPSRK